ncbi:unnamed protein product [Mucor hiemalis]
MKLKIFNNILLLSTIILCFIISINCVAIGPSVSADEARDIESCLSACKVFRQTFYTFITELNVNSWEVAAKDFTTCQYRCYKCTMPRAIHGMEVIDEYKADFTGEVAKLVIMNLQQIFIIEDIHDCREKWKIAAALNCPKTPIEDAVDLETKDCIL